jgi:hypothetical protein
VFNDRIHYVEPTEDEKILKLREMYAIAEYNKTAHEQGLKKHSRRRTGFSAQQVLDTLRDMYGNNYADIVHDPLVDNPDTPEEYTQLTLSHTSIIPFLVGAVQELTQRIEALEKTTGGKNERTSTNAA